MARWFGAALLVSMLTGTLMLQSARSQPEEQESPRRAIPSRFQAVDTSRVMGSPDPLPLEAVNAFPRLKFERPVELAYADDGSDRPVRR